MSRIFFDSTHPASRIEALCTRINRHRCPTCCDPLCCSMMYCPLTAWFATSNSFDRTLDEFVIEGITTTIPRLFAARGSSRILVRAARDAFLERPDGIVKSLSPFRGAVCQWRSKRRIRSIRLHEIEARGSRMTVLFRSVSSAIAQLNSARRNEARPYLLDKYRALASARVARLAFQSFLQNASERLPVHFYGHFYGTRP